MFRTAKSKTLRRGRDAVSAVRKMVRFDRDILPAERASELLAACDELESAVKRKDVESVATLCDKVEKLADRTFPSESHSSLRENVEVMLVAVIVAMAVRTFVIQPFKIPTGSMQPTLFGIHPSGNELAPYPNGKPGPLEKLVGIAIFGRMYGDEGYRTRGDHIFVDKFSYHFRQPKRGDVVVFETNHIEEMDERSKGKFYIKRLVGIGGDTLQIIPPHILVNGEILNGRRCFQRIYSMADGYNGYQNHTMSRYGSVQTPNHLYNPDQTFTVKEHHLFVLGDNTFNSSDSRYWGDFQRRELVGKAIFVYWPFSSRFGWID